MSKEISFDDEEPKSGAFLLTFVAVGTLLGITVVWVERIFYPVPKGTIGWDFYTVMTLAQIWNLFFCRWFLKFVHNKMNDPKQEKKMNLPNPKDVINQVRVFVLSLPVGGLVFFSFDKFHPEIMLYFGSLLVVSSYLLFIKWKFIMIMLSDMKKNSEVA